MSVSLEGWKSFFDMAAVVLLFLTFLAGAGAMIFGNKVNEKKDEQLRQFNKSLTGAQTELGKQQERTAEADAKVAVLEKDVTDSKSELAKQQAKAAEAEKALIELKERVKDRHLTAEQQKQLIEGLSKEPKGQIEIRCPIGNPEARNFAIELLEIFKNGGWDATLNDRVIIIPTPVGTEVWVRSPISVATQGAQITTEVPVRFGTVKNAFEKAHLAAPLKFNPDVAADGVFLIVGFKP